MRGRAQVATVLVAVFAVALCATSGRDALDARAGAFGADTPFRSLSHVSRSVLAVGDAGVPSRLPRFLDPQVAVGAGLAHEDRRSAADALVLLGDNFYDAGLKLDELEERIRENVVRPYCRFLDLAGAIAPLAARVAGACTPPGGARSAVPIFAVLGNHDYGTPGSPLLQRDVVPLFVANWQVPAGPATVAELGGGLSLLLLDSELVRSGADVAELSDVIRAARGPWRILVIHRPIATEPRGRYASRVGEAIERAGVPVQLVVSGHEHNLQAWITREPAALHAIAGSGARVRPVRQDGHAFALASLGFVRIDLAGARHEDERLYASFFATSRFAALDAPPRLVARWSVGAKGDVRAERRPPPGTHARLDVD